MCNIPFYSRNTSDIICNLIAGHNFVLWAIKFTTNFTYISIDVVEIHNPSEDAEATQ
jgi:hypothetical protein